MDKKFLKILALSALIVALEGNGSKAAEAVCEKMNSSRDSGSKIQTDNIAECKSNKACKLVPLKTGGQACFTVCSQFTKQAKPKKYSLGRSIEGDEDECGEINNACQGGKLWGFYKCRNKRSKEIKTGFSFSDNDS